MSVRVASLLLTVLAGCTAPVPLDDRPQAPAEVALATPLSWNVTSTTGPAVLWFAVDAEERTECTTVFSMAGHVGPRGIHGGAFATQAGVLQNYVYTSSDGVVTAEPSPDTPPVVIGEDSGPSYGINWDFETVGPVELVFFGHGWETWFTEFGDYGPLRVEIRCGQPTPVRVGAGSEVLAFHGLTLDNGTTMAVSPPFGARVELISANLEWYFHEPLVTVVAASRSGFGSDYAETWKVQGPTESSTQMRPGQWSHVMHDGGGRYGFELERQRAAPSTCLPPCPLIVTEPLVAVAAGHHPVRNVHEAVLAWQDGAVLDG